MRHFRLLSVFIVIVPLMKLLLSRVWDASEQDTNGNVLLSLTHMLTDTLSTGDIDYLTPDNTAVTEVQQLKALTLPPPGRRLLLQARFAPFLRVVSKI